MTEISQIIKNATKTGYITQSAMAKYLNTTPQSVSAWAAGRASLPRKHYAKAAKFLGVSVKSFAQARIETIVNKELQSLQKALHKRFKVKVMVG